MQLRMGPQSYQGVDWGETIHLNGVNITLFPAGHMIGSSQVRVEYKGETWVISGDYKLEDDGISTAFEPVRCHTFISESTFGLPIYKWKPQQEIFLGIQDWVLKNKDAGKTSVVLAYSLGKAQRVLSCLDSVSDRILAHGAIYNSQEALKAAGWNLPVVERVSFDTPKEHLKAAVVIAPPSADASPWIRRFGPYSIGVCSGWMQVRGNMRRRNADAGFALSDHADWPGLLEAVKLTGAQKVFVTHGFQAAFSRYLNEIGIEAAEVKTEYGDEDEGAIASLTEEEKLTNDEQ
jgi:putative mRNA 3-end processing factor